MITIGDQPAIVGALIGAGVGLLAAVMSLIIGVINWRQTKRAYSATIETRIEGLYDRLMDYRLKHPEVFRLSRLWGPECLAKIYSQVDDKERQWAIYVGYVELCISYCNATLQAYRRGHLKADVYRSQHERLVRLLVTEHFPIMQQLTQDGFASSLIRNYIDEQRGYGWDWERRYQLMDKPK